MESLADRFLRRVRKAPSGCWEFVGRRNQKGYGCIDMKNPETGRWGTHPAHRISYVLFKGVIAEDLDVDHLCRNKGCVRPLHLQAVTRVENLRRQPTGKYNRMVAKTHCPQGHPYSGDNLIIRKNGARRCRACHNTRRRDGRARERVREGIRPPGDDAGAA